MYKYEQGVQAAAVRRRGVFAYDAYVLHVQDEPFGSRTFADRIRPVSRFSSIFRARRSLDARDALFAKRGAGGSRGDDGLSR